MTALPFRRSCRGLLVSDGRILLFQHSIRGGSSVWVGPGGGVEAGESLIDALTRELHEETGLQITEEHAPQLVWVQTAEFSEMRVHGYAGVINHYFLIDVEPFAPASGIGVGAAGHPKNEGILDQPLRAHCMGTTSISVVSLGRTKSDRIVPRPGGRYLLECATAA
jgi:ADP-ribose pyrophosphatase YjhB (NUDIX family)